MLWGLPALDRIYKHHKFLEQKCQTILRNAPLEHLLLPNLKQGPWVPKTKHRNIEQSWQVYEKVLTALTRPHAPRVGFTYTYK